MLKKVSLTISFCSKGLIVLFAGTLKENSNYSHIHCIVKKTTNKQKNKQTKKTKTNKQTNKHTYIQTNKQTAYRWSKPSNTELSWPI